MYKIFITLLIISICLFAFEPPDSTCLTVIKIVNSRFDNLFSEEIIDTCCFVNRIDPKITWVIYPDKTEVPFNNNVYTVIILKK
ncbi:MAG: hypothetical protein A2V66_11890 [Ignavibacteria bacterium RBG_13_36_8]|nr:MAG: hypothetical protein A2V66_11890 [Ignavibacteria bacterium RBG_13_36_8]